jgi:ATP-dependent Zn protease
MQVRSFIDDAYKRTVGLLRERKDLVDKMAQVCVWGGGGAAV